MAQNDKKHRNIFLNKKYAKSSLALAQISQLLPYYDTDIDWGIPTLKHCIVRLGNSIQIDMCHYTYYLLAFKSRKEAERFLKHNKQLVKDYYMIWFVWR